MSTGERRNRAEALASAERFRNLFTGLYTRWEFAGSIRRQKPDVGDCEHVVDCGGQTAALWRSMDAMLPVEFMGSVTPGVLEKAIYSDGKARYGEKMRGVVFEGFRHEVFIADSLNWGSILTIRTGPAEFSREMVTRMLDRRLYRQQDGYVKYTNTGAVRACPDERTFFELCGEPWREPDER